MKNTIYKNRKKKTHYSEQEILKIRVQMEDSVSHLKEKSRVKCYQCDDYINQEKFEDYRIIKGCVYVKCQCGYLNKVASTVEEAKENGLWKWN